MHMLINTNATPPLVSKENSTHMVFSQHPTIMVGCYSSTLLIKLQTWGAGTAPHF